MFFCLKNQLSSLYFRLRFFFLGLRFYETSLVDGMREISKSDFMHEGEVIATCTFYRLDCNDHVMWLGRVFSHRYASYIVRADMKVAVPPDLEALNGKYFFFNGVRNNLEGSDHGVSKRLLNLFLSFVLEKVKSRTS